jgi:hypothetical protein
MTKMISMLMTGFVLGITVSSYAAVVAGSDGYLLGWTVMHDGEEVCTDPWVWKITKEIECD